MAWKNYFRLMWIFLVPLDVLLKVMVTCSTLVLNYTGLKRGAAWILAPRIKKRKIEKMAGPGSKRHKADGKNKPKQWTKTLVLDPIPALCHVSTELPITSGGGDTGSAAATDASNNESSTTGNRNSGQTTITTPPPPPTFADIVIENNKGKPVYVWVRPHAEQLLRAMARCGGYDDIIVFSLLPPPIVRVVMNRLDPGRKLVRRHLFPYHPSSRHASANTGYSSSHHSSHSSSGGSSHSGDSRRGGGGGGYAGAGHPLVMKPTRALFPPASSTHPAVLLSGKREPERRGKTVTAGGGKGVWVGTEGEGALPPQQSVGEGRTTTTSTSTLTERETKRVSLSPEEEGAGRYSRFEVRPKMAFASLYTSTSAGGSSSSSAGVSNETTATTIGSVGETSSSFDTDNTLLHFSARGGSDEEGDGDVRSGTPPPPLDHSSSRRSSSITSSPSLSSPPEPRAFTPPPPTSPLDELPPAVEAAIPTTTTTTTITEDEHDGEIKKKKEEEEEERPSDPVPAQHSVPVPPAPVHHDRIPLPRSASNSLYSPLDDSLTFGTSTTCTTTFHSQSHSLTSLSTDEGSGSPTLSTSRVTPLSERATVSETSLFTTCGDAETEGGRNVAQGENREGQIGGKKKRRGGAHHHSSSSSSLCSASSSCSSRSSSSPLHSLEVDPRHVVILSSNREVFKGSCFENNVLCIEPYNPLIASSPPPPSSSSSSSSLLSAPVSGVTEQHSGGGTSFVAGVPVEAPKKRRGFLGGRKEVEDRKKVLKTVEPILRALTEVEDVREVLKARKT